MAPQDEIAEQILILRCQTGDREALEKLIIKYSKPLRNFISQILSKPEEVEDILQNTWPAVLRKIVNLREPGKFQP